MLCRNLIVNLIFNLLPQVDMNLASKSGRIQHYLLESNPYKKIDSFSKLIENNLFQTQNKDIAIINKPPGLVLSSRIFLISLKR